MGLPRSNWRRGLANLVVGGHRFVMCVVFFVPIAVILRLLADEHSWVALLTGGVMVVGFMGTIMLAPKLLAISPNPARRGTVWRAFLRLYRILVGNGYASQALAKRIDPLWLNPYPSHTPYETAVWLASVEVVHWALLATSAAPTIAALWYGYYFFGFVSLALSVLFNLFPNLVIRDTRRRLYLLMKRTPVAGSANSCRQGGPEPNQPLQ